MNKNTNKLKWKVRDLLFSLFILIGLYILSTIAISGFFKPSGLFLEIIGSIFLLVPIFYLKNKYPLRLFSGLNQKSNLKCLLSGTALCVVLNIFYGVSARVTSNVPEQYALFVQYGIVQKLLDLFNSLILAPVLEEIFFRGFIYRILRNRYDIFWGALGSTMIFIFFHGLKFETIINIGILGLIFIYVYQKTDSIILTALTHSICSASWLAFIHHGLKG